MLPRDEVELAALQPVPAPVVNGAQREDGDGRQVVIEVGDMRQVPGNSRL